ncbi:MAG: hypothetical protein IJC26_08990 [Clostridia bacterium]|nr:hypothetical protein [Clostridia bacterium]
MEKIGVVKEIDSLGRIVIPKEVGQRYALENEVEVIATKEGVLIQNREYELVRIKRD